MTKQDLRLWKKEMRNNNYDVIVVLSIVALCVTSYNAYKQEDAMFLIGTGISISIILITLILSYRNRFAQK